MQASHGSAAIRPVRVAGPLPGDPYAAAPPERPWLDEVSQAPGRLRIAFTRRAPTGVAVHADCVAAVEDAASLCESLGHDVEEIGEAYSDGLGHAGMLVKHPANGRVEATHDPRSDGGAAGL